MRGRGALAVLLLALVGVSAPAQRLYWREPQPLPAAGTRFPTVVTRGGLVVAVWQEMKPPGLLGSGGEIRLSLATSRDLRQWRTTAAFAGPYAYPREELAIYSVAVTAQPAIFVAILSAQNEVTVLRSLDEGRSFETAARLDAGATILSPTLSVSASGGLMLFVTREREDFFEIYYAVSADGVLWQEFRPLAGAGGQASAGMRSTYLPHHAAWNGVDYVAFQGQPEAGRYFQLYVARSADGGRSWEPGRQIAFGEPLEGREFPAEEFGNQRPFLYPLGGRLGLVWERQFRSNPVQVYYAELDGQGGIAEPPEAVTEPGAAALAPRLLEYRDAARVFWFDRTQGANQVFLGERAGAGWRRTQLSVVEGGPLPGASYFPQPVLQAGQLYVFWENRVGTTSRLYVLEPDQAVAAPTLLPPGFRPGVPSREKAVRFAWRYPSDSSGVAGASYAWSQDPAAKVPTEFPLVLPPNNSVDLEASRDGEWYFRLAVQDYAGNWSETVALSYLRDTTPPAPPSLELPPTDEEGALVSNTFGVRWTPDSAETPAGYSYSLEYLGATEPAAELPPAAVTPRVMTRATEVSYRNRDDGYWRFSVAALDQAGNVGQPATALLRLNKYVPETIGTYVSQERDALGETRLTIGGRGFTVGGTVTQVLLDRDGEAPYDYTLLASEGRFRVANDRLIQDVVVGDVEPGVYRVGVVHPVRGVAFTSTRLTVESTGTVKIGDFSDYRYVRPWTAVRSSGAYVLPIEWLVVWLVVALLAVGLLLSARRLAAVVQEGRMLHREVLAVLSGEARPGLPGRVKIEELRKAGMGLRLKFTILITILVLMTVLMVAVPLGFYMFRNQRQTLTEGLLARTEVLLESVASNAGDALRRNADIELLDLPDAQVKSMQEAEYITLTGPGADDPGRFDYVWGSNDSEIDQKLRAGRFERVSPGTVRLQDAVSPAIDELEQQINTRARQEITGLLSERQRLLREADDAARREGLNSKRFVELERELKVLNGRITSQLREVGAVNRVYPEFDPQNLQRSYTFYRPVVYERENEDLYFRGAVRMGISTDRIQAELSDATRNLLIRSGIIALAAAGLGLIGAFFMASLTVRPIIQISREVRKISETKDKTQLKGEPPIAVKSKDEIGVLAADITQMRTKLVDAEEAAKELTVGKDIQRMFLPLQVDASGAKLSTFGQQDTNLEIFGYYEGADEVSGDYFDSVKLQGDYHAVVKSDVSGHGVSAALIMVQVATICSTHFRNWNPKAGGLEIDRLVRLVNDMVEERGFRGRFATLTVAVINGKSGRLHLCHAGDTKQHIYRAGSRRTELLSLPDAPPAGFLSSDLVEMKGGFKVVTDALQPGDTLLLFTDGIPESKRRFRNAEFQPISAEIDGKTADHEELGEDRIYGIVDAVMNRRSYRLVKKGNPPGEEELEFDFSAGKGSVEEVVLGVLAVERVWRLVPDPSAGPEDIVHLDPTVHAIVKAHFRQYDRYFHHPGSAEEHPGQGMAFSHLREDKQEDDLTFLAVRKK